MHRSLASTIALLVVAGTSLGACSSTTRSTNLDTAGIHVRYGIVDDPPMPIRAVAEFRVLDGTGSHLELVGGDGVTVDGLALRAVSDGSFLRYEGDVGAGVEHVFTFTRDGEPPISHRITEAPRPVPTVDGLSTATAAFTEQVPLRWTLVAGSDVAVVADSPDLSNCSSRTLVDKLADVGAYTIDAAVLHPPDHDAPCNFRITVVRTHDEPIGAPFSSGYISATARGAMDLTLR